MLVAASTAYFTSSAAWSLGGLIVGYMLGRIMPADKPVRHHWPWFRAMMGILILCLVVLTTAMSFDATRRLNDTTACQERYNEEFRAGISERTKAADLEREAQRKLFRALLDPNSSQEIRTKASREYLASLDQADQQRAESPIPVATCGDGS